MPVSFFLVIVIWKARMGQLVNKQQDCRCEIDTQKSTKRKAVESIIWDFIGIFGSRGISFLISIFLTRLLLPAEFGLVALVMVFIGIAQIFNDAGFSSAIIQAKEVSQTQYATVWVVNNIVSLILYSILFMTAPFIAAFYQNQEITLILRVIGFSMVISGIVAVQGARLVRNLEIQKLTGVQLLVSLISGGIAVLMAYRGYGVWSLVAQTLIGSVLGVIGTLWITKWIPVGEISFSSIKPFWAFGSKLYLSAILEFVSSRIDYILVGKLFNTTELGYYTRGRTLSEFIQTLQTSSIFKIFLPVVGQLQDNKAKIQCYFDKSFPLLLVVTMFFIGNFYIISVDLFTVLFGKSWIRSVPFFQIMILTTWAYPVSALIVTIINGVGRSRIFLEIEIYKKLLILPSYLLVVFFSIKTMLWGLFCVSFFLLGVNIYGINKALHVNVRNIVTHVALKWIYLLIAIPTTMALLHLAAIPNPIAHILVSSLFFSCVFSSIVVAFSPLHRVQLFGLVDKLRDLVRHLLSRRDS